MASRISTCRRHRNGSGALSNRRGRPRKTGHGIIVYRSMDRQALDAAYNNSAAVADSDQYLANWWRRSEALRSRMPQHLDLIYGDTPRTKLDLFATDGSGAALCWRLVGRWPSHRDADGRTARGRCPAISGLFDLEPIRLCYLNDKL